MDGNEGIKKDKVRDDYMEKHGLKVLRFSDRDVFVNLKGLIERIYKNLPLCLIPPSPPLEKGGEKEIHNLNPQLKY